jgi:hypothetical protein
VTVAHLHAITFSIVATLVTAAIFGRDLDRIPSFAPPVVSVLAGTFIGFVALNVWWASHRVPRRKLTLGSRLALVVAGGVAGFCAIGLLGH